MNDRVRIKRKYRPLYVMLPSRMIPNRSVFEELGFVFFSCAPHNAYKSKLPAGWKIKKGTNQFYFFMDEKRRVRGTYSLSCTFGQYNGFMELFHRFVIMHRLEQINEYQSTVIVYILDSANDTCISEFGKYRSGDWQFYKNEEEAELFLNIHYPFWHDVRAYWE